MYDFIILLLAGVRALHKLQKFNSESNFPHVYKKGHVKTMSTTAYPSHYARCKQKKALTLHPVTLV